MQFAVGQSFVHPGVLVSQAQLNFIKAEVKAGAEPFHSAFVKSQSSVWGSLTYKPLGPPEGGDIDCGPYSKPNHGCSADDRDGTAAYLQALLWVITGNHAYAQNAITLMNTYAQNLKKFTNSNAPLQAAWSAAKWTRAAEIIRYSDAGWSAPEIAAFEKMLTTIHLPLIIDGTGHNGNQELTMIEAMINIAVFTNDRKLFDHAVAFWHERVPAYFYYFPIDGNHPVPPPRGKLNWNGQTVFDASTSGVSQETCRDFGHTQFGIASTINAAETAAIQGTDLYGPEEARITAALEFHARYLLGENVPVSICGGNVKLVQRPTFEIAYNQYHNRKGRALPFTLRQIETHVRESANLADEHMMAFETLTHGADAAAARH